MTTVAGPERVLRSRRSIPGWLALDLMLVGVIVVLLIVGQLSVRGFLQPANVRVVLMACVVTGLLALAQALALIVREIDLALGATLVAAPLLAVHSADQITYALTGRGLLVGLTGGVTGGWWMIIGLTVMLSVGIGVVMGVIIAYLNVPSFVVTIGMSFILIGTGYVISQGTPISFQTVEESQFVGNTFIANLVPWSFICFLMVALVLSFFINWTKLGPRLYATGGNTRAAALSGVDTRLWCVFAYAIAGAIVAIAAILNMSRMQGVDVGQNANFALQSIVIAILGGVGVRGGEGRVSGVVLATIAFTLLLQILSSFGFNYYAQMAVTGFVVLVFTAVSKRADSQRLRHMKKIEV
ncbi:hypothetical protein [Microbacterium sp. KRD172]|uniref:ABC transporter permease subunit n=1 Tax=Microbacterium sp. KRD172 TaxID=2729727 RepID=UPI0019D08627|nr:hypothetical protein [Microbacterium sp. KRD172]